jgi:hypothetical protein
VLIVKCLFDPMTMDAEMDDIKDIADNSMLQPESYFQSKPCSADFDEAFFAGSDEKVKFYTGLPSFEILQKV